MAGANKQGEQGVDDGADGPVRGGVSPRVEEARLHGSGAVNELRQVARLSSWLAERD